MKYIAVVVLSLLTIACEKDYEGLDLQDKDQIVFQAEYVNYAWGKVNKGFFITADGSKYEYDNPEKWVFPENDLILADDFIANIQQCEKVVSVDLTKLNQMKSLVLKVDEHKLGERKAVMADAGSEQYCFYIKDPAKNQLRRIVLLSRGDFFQENTDKEAQEIASWLMELNQGGVFSDKFFN